MTTVTPVIDDKQVLRASKALLKYVEKKSGENGAQLIEDETSIWLVVALKRIPEKKRVKPIRIPTKHIIAKEDARVCLFTRDSQQKYKDLLKEKEVNRVEKVIGLTKLRSKYKQYEAKRLLCSTYDLFLADAAIIPLLPRVLGKKFFEKKKLPIPVDLSKKNLKAEIMRACHSTYMSLSAGTCLSIRIGHSGMSAKHVAENIVHAVPSVVDHIPRKWRNILSLSIRTSDSVSLPFYNAASLEESNVTTNNTASTPSSEEITVAN
ncbi:ribosomal protein L1/ribosomal biogenesis protein [Syncephalis plumigaleata]|nr:ribosomal protein L1/ribosomal biogenesis protein [Syncephalis plumigaleata]